MEVNDISKCSTSMSFYMNYNDIGIAIDNGQTVGYLGFEPGDSVS